VCVCVVLNAFAAKLIAYAGDQILLERTIGFSTVIVGTVVLIGIAVLTAVLPCAFTLKA